MATSQPCRFPFKATSVITCCVFRSVPWRWLKIRGIQICQRKFKNSPDRSDSHYLYESGVLSLQVNMMYKVPDSASPFQDWNRMSCQSKQVIMSLKYLMNDYFLGALSSSSSTTPGAKLPPARNWGSIQDSSLLHRLLGLSRGFQINRLSSQSMASSCPQPCSARKVLEDSKRPR